MALGSDVLLGAPAERYTLTLRFDQSLSRLTACNGGIEAGTDLLLLLGRESSRRAQSHFGVGTEAYLNATTTHRRPKNPRA